ncbi:hypothetical protein H9X96_00225 [Pedobacter sp. N36a]|uniref:hypothetical protein n=1 Tax=Pedobacter sp. N36a TaxID=2767996 RepID=UPI00165759EA|nr:hypothetical protein [Pedobacter sp. N36a]MBC8984196.1 hypothetical protein [Pedobacter sp. N36a]
MKKLILLLALGFSFTGCSSIKSSKDGNTVTLTGKIEKTGMTTYQYGTHTIQADHKTYTLKSSSVDLNSFENKEVELVGTKVPGYPVENGPVLIEVSAVKLK